jgi:hypothetical protein
MSGEREIAFQHSDSRKPHCLFKSFWCGASAREASTARVTPTLADPYRVRRYPGSPGFLPSIVSARTLSFSSSLIT